MNRGRKSILALAAVAALGVTGVVEASQGVATITISGQVPLVCRVSVDNSASVMLSANGNKSLLREFCNNGAGYRVVASYSKQLAAGRLVVDGRSIPLNASGEVLVSDVASAASSVRTIAIEGDGKLTGSIRFRIEPR
ncbi:hypothetical protein [Novosphingobium taihuense]|uniref:Uncharacterized protein n=1 Tax=Novosphingobium taihuense TaxID=260085 RepID=A0A7W7AAQ8_9SPHN|nr:hypothetical protein [Novosphingobium taihuense]MBB4613568.1 hypothetical protein [Novosphingobium taihuense]TWH81188.1 hypothetical protein IQ25_03575 [Novosphingobium taihuense]